VKEILKRITELLLRVFGISQSSVHYVNGGESLPEPFTTEEEAEMVERLKDGEQGIKDKLVEHNLRLVVYIARRFMNTGVDMDDLISVGTIGLIKAVNTYNPEKGTGLATYTAKCIENEILMLLRANKKYQNSVSLYDSVGSDKDGNELTLLDLIPSDKDELFEKVERKTENKKLNEIIKKCLSKREYMVIKLRYGLEGAIPLPQREVARFLKISRSYISRIEKKAIEKIRQEINESGVTF
jgi:RNA polymerase sporulation-specific sigma factor